VNQPKFISEYYSFSLPRSVVEYLKNNECEKAAEALIIGKYPFNPVVRCLSNFPEALIAYFYKRASIPSGSAATQQLLCHLYIETAVNHLQAYAFEHKEKSPEATAHAARKDVELKRISKFIVDNKNNLDADAVLKIISRAGQQQSLYCHAAETFGQYEEVIRYSFAIGDLGSIDKYINFVPQERQRQICFQFCKANSQKYLEMLNDNSIPIPLSVTFDTICNLVLNIPADLHNQGKALVLESTRSFVNLCYQNHLMNQPAYLHIYFLTLAFLEGSDSEIAPLIKEFINNPANIAKIDADFLCNLLCQNGCWSLAADLYARVSNRHLNSINCAIHVGQSCALDLLYRSRHHRSETRSVKREQKSSKREKHVRSSDSHRSKKERENGALSDAIDAAECWIYLLKLVADEKTRPKDADWPKLLKEVCSSKLVPLDEIFKIIPYDINLNSPDIQMVISEAVKAAGQQTKDSAKVRQEIEKRVNTERNIVVAPDTRSLTVDPCDALCCLCGQPAIDAPFDVFPCGHLVHMNCYLANMHDYFDCKTRLQLISLANIRNQKASNYSEIAEKLTASCPACGTVSLAILDHPFVIPKEEDDEIVKWDIPIKN